MPYHSSYGGIAFAHIIQSLGGKILIMEYARPEGCRAAVTSGWERVPGGFLSPEQHKLTAQLVCGARIVSCNDTFTREFLGTSTVEDTEDSVGQQVTELLGAMCLGCPNNLQTSQRSD